MEISNNYKIRQFIHKTTYTLFFITSFSMFTVLFGDPFPLIWSISWIFITICTFIVMFDEVDLEFEMKQNRLRQQSEKMYDELFKTATELLKSRIEQIDKIRNAIREFKEKNFSNEEPFIIYDTKVISPIKRYLQ